MAVVVSAAMITLAAPAHAATSTGAVRGAVTDSATGDPVPGACATILDAPGTPTTVAGADGRFLLEGIATGDYVLEVSDCATGRYYSLQTGVSVHADAVTEIEVQLTPPGAVEGTVRDGRDGAALANICITIDGRVLEPTGADGRFTSRSVVPGTTIVNAADCGDEPRGLAPGGQTVQVAPGETTTVDIVLQPSGAVAGTIIDAVSEQPIATCIVIDGLVGIASGPDGRFLYADLAPGDHALLIDDCDTTSIYDPAEVTVHIEPGLTTNVEIVLLPRSRAPIVEIDDSHDQPATPLQAPPPTVRAASTLPPTGIQIGAALVGFLLIAVGAALARLGHRPVPARAPKDGVGHRMRGGFPARR